MIDGVKFKESPFYKNNTKLRRGNIIFEYSDDELFELKRCKEDIVYFANKYCKAMTEDGVKNITLRPYQEDMLRHMTNNQFSIIMASRQIGKTVCSGIKIMHYLCFSTEKNVLLTGNIWKTSKEIRDKIETSYEELPFFLKPGLIINNIQNMKFDNGCRLITETAKKRSGISFTIHFLYMDEFAHIEPNIIDEFYESMEPTVAAVKNSTIVITSTPNGFNKFAKIYEDAEAGKNSFKPFRVDWWQVPGRDQTWYEQEVANLGGEDEFMRQHGNSFLTSADTLLTPL
ncbi:MAG: hypothetical protein EOM74_00855 [Methanomicrobia archaeon]|nr:hypothetical protein [Methanomicrobia archaeon]